MEPSDYEFYAFPMAWRYISAKSHLGTRNTSFLPMALLHLLFLSSWTEGIRRITLQTYALGASFQKILRHVDSICSPRFAFENVCYLHMAHYFVLTQGIIGAQPQMECNWVKCWKGGYHSAALTPYSSVKWMPYVCRKFGGQKISLADRKSVFLCKQIKNGQILLS